MIKQINFEFPLENSKEMQILAGSQDKFLLALEEGLGISISQQNNSIILNGDEKKVAGAKLVISELLKLIRRGVTISSSDIASAISMQKKGTIEYFHELYSEILLNDAKNRPIRVKNFSQRKYIQSIRNNQITVSIGPAGTGKTFLAVAMSLAFLKHEEIEKIIITRPAVEAGESLGFLPGNFKEKVDPYLRPIYDALSEIIGSERSAKMIDRDIIEVAPLAYMRGRTLNNSFIILDEAQNTTPPQMKMFLTRLGFNSKMIANGDISQIDLPKGTGQSGLVQAYKILNNIKSIGTIQFSHEDVVRNPLVGLIVKAYDEYDKNRKKLKK